MVIKYVTRYTAKNRNIKRLSLFLNTMVPVVLKLNKIPQICPSSAAKT
jgi:hypothetical protein